jgi:hypothetical protein
MAAAEGVELAVDGGYLGLVNHQAGHDLVGLGGIGGAGSGQV